MTIRPSEMSKDEFVSVFGGVYEHSAWVAEAVWEQGLSGELDSPEGLARAMANVVARANLESRMELIRAHPELASKAALAGELTEDSREEQAGAGLDRCSPEELHRLRELNDAYGKRFGFPFIVAVRGLTRQDILRCLESRLNSDYADEVAEALRQIDRIASLRLVAHPLWQAS
jgi:2-oxo-4-hydroxy-4-carboxy-5-ureidoimidazoline decarboxylase